MVEHAVSVLERAIVVADIFLSRKNLSPDIVNSCHILSAQSPEIVSQGASQSRMMVIILNQVTDIFHTVLSAPASDLLGEVLLDQSCHCIHIGITQICSQIRIRSVLPQKWKLPEVLLSDLL